METVDKTVERQEMATLKEGNRTLAVAVDNDWSVSHIDCLCEWHVVNFYPVILDYHHHIVAGQIGHQVEPYPLSSVEIHSSTLSVIQRWW